MLTFKRIKEDIIGLEKLCRTAELSAATNSIRVIVQDYLIFRDMRSRV